MLAGMEAPIVGVGGLMFSFSQKSVFGRNLSWAGIVGWDDDEGFSSLQRETFPSSLQQTP